MAAFLIMILVVAAWPAHAIGADITWTMKWQSNQVLIETVSGDDLSILEKSYGWQEASGTPGVMTRTTQDWTTYDSLQQRLPLQTREKNYFLFKTIRLQPDSPVQSNSTLQQLFQKHNGSIVIEVPGFIKDYTATEVKPTADGFTATWKVDAGSGPETIILGITAIILNVLPIVITSLAVAWLIIWILFRRQVKRMNQLIEEEYSLDNLGTDHKIAVQGESHPAAFQEENTQTMEVDEETETAPDREESEDEKN